jgi:DNA-binding transcriptional MerR regulator
MKIGDVADVTGVTAKTIRFYEEAGLLPAPARTSSGYRDYDPEVVERLRFIHRGQAAGLTLAQVRQILAVHDRGDQPCGHVRDILETRLEQVHAQLAELTLLEGHLRTLLERAEHGLPTEHDSSAVCWILENEPAGSKSATNSGTGSARRRPRSTRVAAS